MRLKAVSSDLQNCEAESTPTSTTSSILQRLMFSSYNAMNI